MRKVVCLAVFLTSISLTSISLGLPGAVAQTAPAAPTYVAPGERQNMQPQKSGAPTPITANTPVAPTGSDAFAGKRCKTLFCAIGLMPTDDEPKPDLTVDCGPLCTLIGIAPHR